MKYSRESKLMFFKILNEYKLALSTRDEKEILASSIRLLRMKGMVPKSYYRLVGKAFSAAGKE